ncbi:MAG: flavin reductase family protein [Lachnospiraceae bacterium]
MLYPLPVIMVSCKRDLERPNIITLAWAGTINSDPAMVSISVRKERYSYSILKESKEFVINLVNKELIYATDFCGVRSGKEYDKFQEMNLTAIPSKTIAAPGIKESPVNIECKVEQVIPLGSHDLFIARVTAVAVDGKYMDDKGKFDLNSSGLVAYSHGEYFELGKRLGKFGYSVKKTSRKRN